MPSSEHTPVTVDRLSWYAGDCGGPIRRNHPSSGEWVLHPAVPGSKTGSLPKCLKVLGLTTAQRGGMCPHISGFSSAWPADDDQRGVQGAI